MAGDRQHERQGAGASLVLWLGIGVSALGAAVHPVAAMAQSAEDSVPLKQHAYAIARQAFIYGYAPDGMYRRLSAEVLDPKTRKAGFNAFAHTSELSSPTLVLFPAPNVDTIYSTALLDVRNEPAILTSPDTGDRYWTAQLLDFDSNTFTNFGSRLDGNKAGTFAVVGPNWKGQLPPGITRSVNSPTGFVAVLLRVLVKGEADLPTAVEYQKRFQLASLSRFQRGAFGPTSDNVADIPLYNDGTAADRLRMLDRLLTMNPVRPGEEALMSQFATIGVGPGKVLWTTTPDAATLERAWKDADAIVADVGTRTGVNNNGWLAVPKVMGSYGTDYLQRASIWRGGALAQLPEEAFYPTVLNDSAGKPLDGSKARYTIHFAPGQLPPAKFFWSITLYDLADFNLIDNPIKRYSIGNRSAGLKYAPDGSLTLLVQKASPGKGRESNWLPAPDRPFYMTMRLYGAEPAALDGTWKMPTVAPVR